MLARALLFALIVAPACAWTCVADAMTQEIVPPLAAGDARTPAKQTAVALGADFLVTSQGSAVNLTPVPGDVAAFLVSLGCRPSGAADFAAHIAREAPRRGIDWRLASAVLRSESTCQRGAVGKKNERGGWQLLSTDPRYRHYTTAQLHNPHISTRLAMRRLAHARDNCLAGAPPIVWLSGYAGLKCGESRYSRRVIARMEGERRS